jgi:hypothetical protein
VLTVLLRWTKKPPLDRLIVVGGVVYLSAYCFSTMAIRGAGGGYEFVGIVPLFAVLSARNLTDLRWPRFGLGMRAQFGAAVALTAVIGSAAVGCLLSGSELYLRFAPDDAQSTVLWLKAHGFTNGLAAYWDATPMTVYSADTVKVRAMLPENGAFLPQAWGSNSSWYDASKVDMNFVVTGGYRGSLTVAMAEKSFGTPVQVYHVSLYTILVYNYNLLDRGLKVHLPSGA